MQRFHLALLVFIITGSFFIYADTWGANSDIIINEIAASPTSTHEWIEIWNKGTEPVDLTGWKFWEGSTNHSLTATTTDNFVAPGEYATICQNGAAFIIDHPVFGGSIFDSSWSSLSESGEEIGLKDATGNFIEQFTYQPTPQHSLERKNPLLSDYSASNWQEHPTGDTLGLINSNYSVVAETTSTPTTDVTTTPYSLPSTSSIWAQIKINEFLPDPDNADEWIELFNPTTTSLDLADGTLCDNRDTSCTVIATTGTIAASSWATFFLTSSHLNNSGDSIILKNPDGVVVDQINYGTNTLSAPEKGQTMARKNDGADTDTDADWAITVSPTPNAGNVIVEPAVPAPTNNNSGGSSGGGGGSTTPTTSSAPVSTNQKTTTSTNKTTTKGIAGDQIKIIWELSAPHTAAPQESATMSAASSADPRGGAIFFSWNLGDGTIIDGQTISHAFAASGTYHVVASATSTQGTTGQQTFSITVAPGLSSHHGEILISEIYPNPPGADQGEFIELFNSASNTVSLAGWKIGTNSGKDFVIPEKTFIKPNGCLVFYRAATHLVLDNTKENVILKTPDDVVADQASYSKSEPNQSWSLVNGVRSWTATITPGFIGENVGQVLGEKITASPVATKPRTPIKPTSTPTRLSLASARALPKGNFVSIQGTVTVPPGTFSEHYFYVADSSGGLQMYSSKKDLPPVAIGDTVAITGQISQANNIPRVKIASARAIDILATNQPLTPESLALGDIDEDTAGKLVVVAGEITDIKGNQLFIDDGETEGVVYLKTAAHIDRSRLRSGDNLRITGIAEQTKNGWQIWPRSSADITIAPIENAQITPRDESTLGALVQKKYIITTVAGLAALGLALALRLRLNKP